MLLKDKEIQDVIESGGLGITPFDPERLQGASYDLSLGGEALVSGHERKVILASGSGQMLHLEAGDFALVLTKETVKFPDDMAGVIGMRSSLARKGLMLLAGMQIDPGFEGHLRFGLYNASPRRITLDYDDELCMIEFHKLNGPVDRPAARNVDLIEGRIPESDRDFLMSLETTSLSDLASNVKTLSTNVAMVSNQVGLLFKIVVPLIMATFAGVVVAVIVALLN